VKTKTYRTLAVGVTGGIGSGKSEVCRIFEELGARAFSADDLALDIMETNTDAKKSLVRAFGENIYTAEGKLDRARLAEIIFHVAALRRKANAIVHPYVLRRMREVIQQERSLRLNGILVFEAALIYESGADALLDYVIVVDGDKQTRLRRVMQRDGTSQEEVLLRMKAQLPEAQKVRKADFVINNNGDFQSLKTSVEFFYKLFMKIISSTDNGQPP